MARYNSSSGSTSINGTATISSPFQGAFTNLTGTAPYTVTLPSPVLFPGTNQTFYNATAGTVTLSTPSGVFSGTGASGTSTSTIFTGNVLSVTSDGTNYIVISEDGSPLIATTGSFSSDVTITGASATVNIQPSSLTLYPGSIGAMDRVAIGVNNRSSGAFTSLAANAQVSLTANTASTSTSTGSLVVTGGVGVTGNIWSGATVNASSVVATGLTGTLQTAAQLNITSTGGLTVPTLILNPGTGIGVIRRSAVSGSNGVRIQGNAADGYPNDANAGAYIQLGGGTIGDTYEGNVDIVAYGGNVDANRNQIRFSNRSSTNTITERMRIDKDGNVGIGIGQSPTQKLHVNGSYGLNSSGPATSGTTQNGLLRLTPQATVYGETLDFGMNVGPTYAWIQSTNKDGLVTNYPLALNPNGGNVGIGTQIPGAKLDIKLAADGDFLIGRHSASTAKLVYAYQLGSDGYLELRTGADAIVTKLSGYVGTPSYFLSNVGIGTNDPGTGYAGAISNVKLALRGGVVGQAGGTATLLIGSDNNHYSSISSTHTGGGQTYLTLSTSASVSNPIERMRIDSAGKPTFSNASIGLASNATTIFTAAGYAINNQTISVTISAQESSTCLVVAMHNHYGLMSGYGCARMSMLSNGNGGMQEINVSNSTSGNGGAWTFANATASTFTITKSAGTYIGGGYYTILVIGNYISN